ncbi:hypothetical protein ACPCG0_04770 [Propionibacteriaceae bacterium Y1923]|uniref:hypothetical protein n=1 Tax=Aestuariimicrobium sp. Y1814 TaxID=3418742 RepID=UPI003C1CA9DE
MTDLERAADAAARQPSRRDPVAGALAAEGPLRLAEAEARLVLQDRSLVRVVRLGGEKLRAERGGRAPDPEQWRRRGRPPRWSAIVGLLVVLLAPLLSAPFSRWFPYADAGAARRFFLLLGASYAVVCLLQLELLVRWVRDPLGWAGTRLVASLLVLLMLVVLPWFVVPALAMVPGKVAVLGVVPFTLAMVLAAANLWAVGSERTRAHA